MSEAIRKRKMKDLVRRIISGIKRRIDPTDNGRVKRIMNNPPPVRDDEIVFASSSDFSGNPKALFLYMINNGYNEKYHITWMFEKEENYFEFDIPNVSSEIIWNRKGIRRPAAQRAAMSAKYIFYSHNVNWIRRFREEQNFINLWHGCGYKADMKSDKRKIYYDYLMVTGKKYIDIFREVLKNPDGNILDLGYPRNEFLISDDSNAQSVLDELKRSSGASKSIIWLPTYRKSVFERLSSDSGLSETGLPILSDEKAIIDINEWCTEQRILLILKQHFLQSDYGISFDELSNIVLLSDDNLRELNVEFYELMGKTDALLTDYSSAAIDYMLTDKPIGYTLDDFEGYEQSRGWSFDNVKDFMPGHHIYDMTDLKTYIKDVADGLDPYADWRHRVSNEAHTYTDSFSKRILDYFGI